ncbi:Transcriptional regulator, GntR family [Pseudoalteromonas luteoviolacea B = ATCC 29581]|nr:Transcriptional regulator, GntR family [Pseudoalteromonas luteoviolacea B = ATCC 29581]
MLEQIVVNPHSGDPIYKQLHEQIVRLIASEQISAGEPLPSVRQIAEYFSINPMTVSRAIQQLVEQGWLVRRRGQPTIVAEQSSLQSNKSQELLVELIDNVIKDVKQLGTEKHTVLALLEARWEHKQ